MPKKLIIDDALLEVPTEEEWVIEQTPPSTKPYQTWVDIERKNNKLAIVGFAPTTRDQTPWEDTSFDIWGVNEEYVFDWFKRPPDLHFQMHPRWDFTRTNNMNHYNHPLWLANKTDKCVRCKGERGGTHIDTDTKKEKWYTCPECNGEGIYTPPAYRANLPIIMQEHWDDIPNSIPFPLEDATNLIPLGDYPYFTSSVAYMLTLAYMLGYEEVHFYGFEMGTKTEYHYQRANFEYLVGLYQGYGLKIIVPKQSTLLKGELYGYKNMKTGFRQNLEARLQFLEIQETEQREKYMRQSGAIQAIQNLLPTHPELIADYNALMPDYAKTVGTHNVIKGAIQEVKVLTELYDHYFLGGTESNAEMTAEDFNKFINVAYTQ